MEQMTKTGRMALYIACFLLLLSVFLSGRAVQSLRRANQSLSRQQQLWPLLEKSLQLSEQINAELWAVREENNAIIAESAKPFDQQPTDLEPRRTFNKQHMEGIQQLLKEQQQMHNRIHALQEPNGIHSEESKAVLEKY